MDGWCHSFLIWGPVRGRSRSQFFQANLNWISGLSKIVDCVFNLLAVQHFATHSIEFNVQLFKLPPYFFQLHAIPWFLAILRMQEMGVTVIAPVHDAVMVEGRIEAEEEVLQKTQEAMRWASEKVLTGFPLDSDMKVVEYPNRYMDEERGADMWNKVMGIVGGPPYIP